MTPSVLLPASLLARLLEAFREGPVAECAVLVLLGVSLLVLSRRLRRRVAAGSIPGLKFVAKVESDADPTPTVDLAQLDDVVGIHHGTASSKA